jgi:NodT family efflux transporter outer membrane factor (OMF) lipoprotein
MRSKGGFKLLLAVALSTLSGCTVGPDYLLPEIGTPHLFTGSIGGRSQNIVSINQADSASIVHWWSLLKDAELESLIDRAIIANPDIKIAARRILAARENEIAVRGGALPEVEASGGAARGSGTNSTKGRVSSPLNAGTDTTDLKEITYVAGFDAGWEIDLFGKNRRALEAAQDMTDEAVETRRAVLVSVVSEVARAYVETRGIQARLKALNEDVARARKTLNLVQTRFKRGLTNELDVTLASRELNALNARVAPLSADEYGSCGRIAILLNTYTGGVCEELAAFKKIPDTPKTIKTGLPVDVIRRRPDVRAAERALAVETARIGIATADLFPRVAITVGGGAQGQGLGVMPVVSKSIYSVGPSLYWPLLDFGTLDAIVHVQQLHADEALLNYKHVVIKSVNEVNMGLARYRALMSTLKALGSAVDESKRAVDLATERYDRGVTDFLNVLDAERQENELEIQYAQARADAADSFIAVYKALGGGWEMFDEPLPQPTAKPAIIAAFQHLRAG